MGMKQFLVLVFIFKLSLTFGQAWTLGGEIGGGILIRHNQKLNFEGQQWSQYLDLRLNWQTDDRQNWAKYHRYPVIQLNTRLQAYSNRDLLGYLIALYPSVVLPINKSNNFPMAISLGTGIGWISKKYDYEALPQNNAIGSNWNNFSNIKFMLGLPLFYNWNTSINFSLSHISNGRTYLPNLGLNTFHIGLSFRQQAERFRVDHIDRIENSWKYRKWYVDLGTHIGFHRRNESGGPLYKTYGFHFALTRSLGAIQRLSLGLESEYNTHTTDYLMATYSVDSRNEAIRESISVAVFVRDEFLFGPVGVGVTAGFYVKKEQTSFPIYNKLDIRYYLDQKNLGNSLFVAVVLKSHKAIAAYLGASAGYRF
jgi:hypothetical protein